MIEQEGMIKNIIKIEVWKDLNNFVKSQSNKLSEIDFFIQQLEYLIDRLAAIREKIQTIERWQSELVVRDNNYDRGYSQALKNVLNELKQ